MLDTNVISEFRKIRRGDADPNVANWTSSVGSQLMFLSVITVMELELGILSIDRRDPLTGSILSRWFETVLETFTDRLLVADVAVVRCCARLHVPDRRNERDALIAATALVHDMAVVTRNVRDFAGTGVRVVDPWQP